MESSFCANMILGRSVARACFYAVYKGYILQISLAASIAAVLLNSSPSRRLFEPDRACKVGEMSAACINGSRKHSNTSLKTATVARRLLCAYVKFAGDPSSNVSKCRIEPRCSTNRLTFRLRVFVLQTYGGTIFTKHCDTSVAEWE